MFMSVYLQFILFYYEKKKCHKFNFNFSFSCNYNFQLLEMCKIKIIYSNIY